MSLQSVRLSNRLPSELKQTIKRGAALASQTMNAFAISSFTQSAFAVKQEQSSTVLSKRDRVNFMRYLDRTDAKPNKAHIAAAPRFKKQLGLEKEAFERPLSRNIKVR